MKKSCDHWERLHGTRPGETLHFDYLYIGDSSPLGKNGLDEGDGFNSTLVMMDELSNFVWLESTESLHGSVECEASSEVVSNFGVA